MDSIKPYRNLRFFWCVWIIGLIINMFVFNFYFVVIHYIATFYCCLTIRKTKSGRRSDVLFFSLKVQISWNRDGRQLCHMTSCAPRLYPSFFKKISVSSITLRSRKISDLCKCLVKTSNVPITEVKGCNKKKLCDAEPPDGNYKKNDIAKILSAWCESAIKDMALPSHIVTVVWY